MNSNKLNSSPRLLIFSILALGLTACNGSSNNETSNPVTSIELIDPTPEAINRFGSIVIQLANGNIVVSDPNDSSVASNSGAVHLYSPFSSTPIASIYGDVANDQLGSNSIIALGNSNFVIASSTDDEGGIVNAGSVRLVNGSTGVQIGDTLAGDVSEDQLGSEGITVLGNNNYVIASLVDDESNIINAGSVRLVNGSTGEQIAVMAGNKRNDLLGANSITALGNNNYVIASASDDVDGIVNAGSVRLVNGSNGEQIGDTLSGDVRDDQLGLSSVTALGNNNFVIASALDDDGDTTVQQKFSAQAIAPSAVVNAGSVRLINGSTGVQIGDTLAGDVLDDQLGRSGITALGNNNYVVVSIIDDENGIANAGSVRLMSGIDGDQISVTSGTVSSDLFGRNGITVLSNNNYVIASALADINGIVDSGSVLLINGSTGDQIGATMAGNTSSDRFGRRGTTALGNNNYVIRADIDDVGNLIDAGSVRLMNGSTGVQIGTAIEGDVSHDNLGRSSITVLSNNNYVIASEQDNEGGIANAGSVRLVNGSTGVQIAVMAGDVEDDELGNAGVFALNNNNYVIASDEDDEGSIADAGSVRLVNGSTGAQIGNALIGAISDDLQNVNVLASTSGDYYIVSQQRAENGGLSQAGKVLIVAP